MRQLGISPSQQGIYEKQVQSPLEKPGNNASGYLGSLAIPDHQSEGLPPWQAYHPLKFSARPMTPITFYDFMKKVEKEPEKYLRCSSQYAVDAIDYYNQKAKAPETITVMGHELSAAAYTAKPWLSPLCKDKQTIYGQERTLHRLRQALQNNAKRPHPNKMIILAGPNGTGKTTIMETLYEALSHYSKQPEGLLYTFNWVFRDDEDDGFDIIMPAARGKEHQVSKYRDPIHPDEVGVSIPANLNANPIFLLPEKSREKLIINLEKEGKLPEHYNTDYLLREQLDTASQKIFDALKQHYFDEYSHIKDEVQRERAATAKVFDHIQVVPWRMSTQDSKGLSFIQASDSQDASMHVITPQSIWSRLPFHIQNAFRNVGLHQLKGPFVEANRGHIFYDDMWKDGNYKKYQFLLRTAEKGKLTAPEQSPYGHATHGHDSGQSAVHENIDVNTWGATNNANLLQLIAESGDYFTSLKERMVVVPVPYELRYRSNVEVYRPKLQQLLGAERKSDPYALEAFSLWTTGTYLFKPQRKAYYEGLDIKGSTEHKSLYEKTISKLTMVEKAFLYQGEHLNTYKFDPKKCKFDIAEERALLQHVKAISDEFNAVNENDVPLLYEGAVGISPRDAEMIISRAVNLRPKEPFTVVEVFDTLEELMKEQPTFHKMGEAYKATANQLDSKGEIPKGEGPKGLVAQVKEHYQERIRYDIHQSLGLIRPHEYYANLLSKYIAHVIASLAGKEVAKGYWDPPNSDKPSESLMEEMEAIFKPNLDTPEARKEYRRELMSEIGTWQNQHKDQDVKTHYDEVFQEQVSRLKGKDIEQSRQIVVEFLRDFIQLQEDPQAFASGKMQDRNPKRIERMKTALERLKEKGYPEAALPKLIAFAVADTEEFKEAIQATKKS